MRAHEQELHLQMRALITATMSPDDGVLSGLVAETADGDHEGVAECLIGFLLENTCVSPTVGKPQNMLRFMVQATLSVMVEAAQVTGADVVAYRRSLLTAASAANDDSLPAAQGLLAAALCSDEVLDAAVGRAQAGAHALIDSLGDLCLTSYVDAAQSDAPAMLVTLLNAALGIIVGIANMAGVPPESVVTAYWEQLTLTDETA